MARIDKAQRRFRNVNAASEANPQITRVRRRRDWPRYLAWTNFFLNLGLYAMLARVLGWI